MRALALVLVGAAGCGRIDFGLQHDAQPRDAQPDATAGCVTALRAQSGRTCAIRRDRTLWCWGSNNDGQLGTGTFTGSPIPVSVALVDVAAIGMTVGTTFALDANANLWIWGANTRHELGDGTLTRNPTPQLRLPSIIAVAGGESHVCSLDAAHNVACWGWNQDGQIGNGGSTDVATPTTVFSGAAQIVAAGRHTCAIAQDASVWCWGGSLTGEDGTGLATNSRTPVQIPNFDAVQLTAGGHFTCARRADSSVWCWGSNKFGTIGDGTTNDALSPIKVPGISGAIALFPAAGRRVCAGLANGQTWCWGEPMYGSAGTSAQPMGMMPPTRIPELDRATLVSAASNHTCAQVGDTILCSGDNVNGDLGDGTTTPRDTFAPVMFPCL